MTKNLPRTEEEQLEDAAKDAFTSEGGGRVPTVQPPAKGPTEASAPIRSLQCDPFVRAYRGRRHDQMADAVQYTVLLRSRASCGTEAPGTVEHSGGLG